MKAIIFVMMFFLVGAFFIISQSNLALDSFEDIDSFISLYKIWLYEISDNLRSVAGHVVKMDWLPE